MTSRIFRRARPFASAEEDDALLAARAFEREVKKRFHRVRLDDLGLAVGSLGHTLVAELLHPHISLFARELFQRRVSKACRPNASRRSNVNETRRSKASRLLDGSGGGSRPGRRNRAAANASHAPGAMLITDLKNNHLASL